MATNYPGALDDDSTVGGGSKPAASTALDASGSGHPVHSAMHQNVGDAIEQIETKLGTGASTPAANKVLVANGTASEWGQIAEGMIASNAISNAKMKDNSVDTAELVDDAVTAAKQGFISAGTSSTKPGSPSTGDIYLQHEA